MILWPGIYKLTEEMAELTVELAKLAAYPHGGPHPDGKGDIVQRVEKEMADVSAILQWFEHFNRLNVSVDRVEGKWARYSDWLLTGQMQGIEVRTPVSDITNSPSPAVAMRGRGVPYDWHDIDTEKPPPLPYSPQKLELEFEEEA